MCNPYLFSYHIHRNILFVKIIFLQLLRVFNSNICPFSFELDHLTLSLH